MHGLLRLFTSFDGRISRKSWWIGNVILWTVGFSGSIALNPSILELDPATKFEPTVWQLLLGIALLFPSLAVMIKRLNDRDHPRAIGYAWACIAIATVVASSLGYLRDMRDITMSEWILYAPAILFAFWISIDCGFLKGTPGPNRFGSDPLETDPDTETAGTPPAAGAARTRWSIGPIVRDIAVCILGLVLLLSITLSNFSPERTGEWLAETIILRKLTDSLKVEMQSNTRGWQAFQAGKAAARAKNFAEAVTHYDVAIESYEFTGPDVGRVLMWRGRAHSNLDKLQSALKDYSEAIAIDPKASAIRYTSRAHVYSRLKRHGDALKDYDAAIRMWPGRADYHLRRGKALHALGRPDQAIASYEAGIAIAHENYAADRKRKQSVPGAPRGKYERASPLERRNKLLSRAQVLRGKVLRDLGRVDEALAAFTEAAQFQPTNTAAHKNQGWLYVQLGELGRARESYERGLKIEADDKWLLRSLEKLDSPDVSVRALIDVANALRDRKQYARALDVYDEALNVKTDHALVWLNRGWLYHLQGRLDEAVADYERAAVLDPANADTFVYRGKAYEELDKLDKASAEFEEALRLNPDHWRAFLWRAWLHHRREELDRAVKDYTRSLEIRPGFGDAHLYRGNAYRDLGQFTKALADYGEALKAAPDNVEVYKNRGWVYWKQGQVEPARTDFEHGLNLSPDDAWLKTTLDHLKATTHKQ